MHERKDFMAPGDKLDGGGLGLSELNELADAFQTIAEIFAKLAKEEKAANAAAKAANAAASNAAAATLGRRS